MDKKLCSVHHLYFKGVECPLCLEERVKRMEEKFAKHNEVVPKEKDNPKEVTEDMLDKLKAKFGSK